MPAAALDEFALLRFSGEDARTFLHGQLTCDVQGLAAGSSTYGGYCTPKGRLLATFLLWFDGTACWMILPASLAEAVRKRLAMYILRSKVKAEDLSPTLGIAGIWGDDVASHAATLDAALPEAPLDVVTHEGVTAVGIPGHRYFIILAREKIRLPADTGAWAGIDIANGIPFILPATQEEFVPQMVNLDLIGALSYTKGCYPGQEIVARTHYLGRLKQRMYRATVDAPVAPGDKLYCAELGDQAGGMIVAAATATDGRRDVLAVLQTANAATAGYHAAARPDATLVLQTLPYAIQ
jgi:hypothetical protein